MQTRLKDAEKEIDKMQAALDEIGRLAMACRMDMQGRLVDDQHKRAFDVLGSIVKRAAAALPDTYL